MESAISVTMTREVSSHKSSSLAEAATCKGSLLPGYYILQETRVCTCSYSALTGTHKDCLFLVSEAQQPEIQPLLS